MAGIKDVMKDVLSQLSTILVQNGDQQQVNPYVRVWNDQLHYLQQGKIESFPMPAFFLEIQNQTRYRDIGGGFRDSDVTLKIHILHEYYNAPDGTYEQDLEVFDLRDKVLVALTYFRPAGCGAIECIVEEQDYTHDNIYHYIMDFVGNFIDSKGSKIDPNRDVYIDSPVPLSLEIDVNNISITKIPVSNESLFSEINETIQQENSETIITE